MNQDPEGPVIIIPNEPTPSPSQLTPISPISDIEVSNDSFNPLQDTGIFSLSSESLFTDNQAMYSTDFQAQTLPDPDLSGSFARLNSPVDAVPSQDSGSFSNSSEPEGIEDEICSLVDFFFERSNQVPKGSNDPSSRLKEESQKIEPKKSKSKKNTNKKGIKSSAKKLAKKRRNAIWDPQHTV